jgi:ABC-type Mn2+/Zn2+ transport system permease subunit
MMEIITELAERITEMMSYPFMQRAVLVGSLVSLCSALLRSNISTKKI